MNGLPLALGAVAGLSLVNQVRKGSTTGSRAHASIVGDERKMTGGGGAVLPFIPTWPAVKKAAGPIAKNDVFRDMLVEARFDIKEGTTREAGFPDTKAGHEGLVWRWLQRRYEAFVAVAHDFSNPLRLYREISISGPGALRLRPRGDAASDYAVRSAHARTRDSRSHWSDGVASKLNPGLGTWWSWSPVTAEAHWAPDSNNDGSNPRRHLVVAEVVATDVDWMATCLANIENPYEEEITLRPGAPVHVLRVRTAAGVVLQDVRGSAARATGLRIDLSEFQEKPLYLVDRALYGGADYLDRKGIAARIPGLGKRLGTGTQAVVYALRDRPDRVVKVTRDPTDAAGMRLVQRLRAAKKATPAMPIVYRVEPFEDGRDNHRWIIEMERLQPVPRDPVAAKMGWALENAQHVTISTGRVAADDARLQRDARTVLDALRVLQRTGHTSFDICRKNVMSRTSPDGTWQPVISDLGYATVTDSVVARGKRGSLSHTST